MTEDELFAKFRRQTRARLDDTDTEDLLGVLLRTEDLADVDDLTAWFRRIS
jgi:hypothetical protein